jgi:D-proline reductase (dithiol) PrdB
MQPPQKTVDGFRFLPPKLSAWIRTHIPNEDYTGHIPFQRLGVPLEEARLSLVTTAGIRMLADPPFDMQREKAEPTWGDPTYREIHRDATEADIDVHHLHINTDYIRRDIDVMLPLRRMAELAQEGEIGELAPTSYSFYGFQWESTAFLNTAIQPMADKMKKEEVDAVVLTPA